MKYPFLLILSTLLFIPACDLENNINQATNLVEENITSASEISEETSHQENSINDYSNLSLETSGQGDFELENRDTIEIIAATFTMTSADSSEITITLADNRTLEFAGNAELENDYTIITSLTNSGMADAEGTLVMQYENGQLKSLEGTGLLDFQPFAIRFYATDENTNSEQNSSSDYIPFYQQQGRGIFSLQGRENENITSMMVQIDENNQATIGVSLQDERIVNFRGSVNHQDAYNINIQLNSSGMADANGLLKLEYGANNSINNLMANGQLDGQNFIINFSK
ncbi:hypothetical protein Cyast_0867 [Cyanobacterium stanieri PCC 7202]|uniref:Uncharacterized protein n=1 Tax=Cyanobacterium stanieri (strain ATCC 29140 / PCC 7202) TaxID=292563 RepID=K9YJ12_CYASC|nr:hypothetical protein Cyast_0867 [Cyanobacterium stanieri PCC 7202]